MLDSMIMRKSREYPKIAFGYSLDAELKDYPRSVNLGGLTYDG